jgi:hypothetical protein
VKKIKPLFIILIFLAVSVIAQENQNIDIDALIEQIISVEKLQQEQIKTLVFDAEYIEGEEKKDGFKEKVRFTKKIYIKYQGDSALFVEEYLEYYKDGELKSEKDLQKEAKKRKEEKKKRNARDVSYSMIRPFYPEWRDNYEIEYLGIDTEESEEYTCHHFKLTAIEETDSLINADYYFDAESFNLIKAIFSPAKLIKKTFFKLNELKMSIAYGPDENGYWLPRRFDIAGKGKAMFFIGVKFAGIEYYRNPIINSNINDKFEVSDE